MLLGLLVVLVLPGMVARQASRPVPATPAEALPAPEPARLVRFRRAGSDLIVGWSVGSLGYNICCTRRTAKIRRLSIVF